MPVMTIKDIKKLSDNDLSLKVAELLGFERIPNTCSRTGPSWLRYENGVVVACNVSELSLHRYVKDLNECHEMEKMHPNLSEYIMFLESIGDGDGMCATARQRCEAFVMTFEM